MQGQLNLYVQLFWHICHVVAEPCFMGMEDSPFGRALKWFARLLRKSLGRFSLNGGGWCIINGKVAFPRLDKSIHVGTASFLWLALQGQLPPTRRSLKLFRWLTKLRSSQLSRTAWPLPNEPCYHFFQGEPMNPRVTTRLGSHAKRNAPPPLLGAASVWSLCIRRRFSPCGVLLRMFLWRKHILLDNATPATRSECHFW
jgi:hypothetical protein